jgi:hypothetical protein
MMLNMTKNRQFKYKTHFLWGIFLASFLLRALVFYGYLSRNENYWQIDSPTYNDVALSLAEGRGFSVEGEPYFYRLPLYPMFLAAAYKVCHKNPVCALWLQIVLASLIPILIFYLALAFFPAQFFLASCASLYSVFHIGLVLYSGFLMSETLFIIFFLLFLIWFIPNFHIFFCKRIDKDRRGSENTQAFVPDFCPEPACSSISFIDILEKNSILVRGRQTRFLVYKLFFAGCFLGLASLVRPVGHYLLLVSIILIVFSRFLNLAYLCRQVFSLCAGWFVFVGPWLIRNFILTGYIFLHTLPGIHFLYLSASRVAMHEKGCTFQEARAHVEKELKQQVALVEKKGHHLSEIEHSNIAQNIAMNYFLNNPFVSLKVWLTDMMRTALSLYSAELVFLESGRKSIDYFNKDRTIASLFKRYLIPETDNWFLIVIIYFEIITFLFILLGFLGSFVQLLRYHFKNGFDFTSRLGWCVWIKVLAFTSFFIVIALAGGYCRMRLGAEPLLIIFSWNFWTRYLHPLQVRFFGE